MKTIGVFTCVRNCEETDYCYMESISGSLAFADQVVVCDAGSTDGTREKLEEMAKVENKIKLVDWEWPNPKGDPWFVVNWYNHARKYLDTDYAFQIEADEIIHESSHKEVCSILKMAERAERARKVKRYNFWKDHRNLLPVGRICGNDVVRIGPSRMYMPSDWPNPLAEEICSMATHSGIELFHYGFIRKRNAFYKKHELLMDCLFNLPPDQRLIDIENNPEINWMESIVQFGEPLIPFTGTHPKLAHQWLIDRGYSP